MAGLAGRRRRLARIHRKTRPQSYCRGIVFLTFCTILATLVVQGLSVPALARALGVERDESEDHEEVDARILAAEAALTRIDELACEGG